MDLNNLKKSAHFVVDAEGKTVAVQLDLTTWDKILALMETFEIHEGPARYETSAKSQLEEFTDPDLEILSPENEVLSLLTQVYDGLSPEEIDEIEEIAFDRTRFFTNRES